MSYRTFVDHSGVTWQVWEVRPTTVERRAADRRRSEHPAPGGERRSGVDRRVVAENRVDLGPELSRGWLAFHSPAEKRRYAPIPDGWAQRSSAELCELCADARPVGFDHSRRHEDDHEMKRTA